MGGGEGGGVEGGGCGGGEGGRREWYKAYSFSLF